ncbi:MAG: hypothetical protein ACLR56_11860 [Oscillospiraceae bacterium]
MFEIAREKGDVNGTPVDKADTATLIAYQRQNRGRIRTYADINRDGYTI